MLTMGTLAVTFLKDMAPKWGPWLLGLATWLQPPAGIKIQNQNVAGGWLAAEPAVWAAREFIPRNLLISTYGAGSRLASCCNCRTSWLLRVPLATNSIEQHSTT